MNEKNEKLEAILNSLKERNMTLDDLKTSGEEYSEEEDIELLDDDFDDEQYINHSNDNIVTNVELREDDSKEVDLGDFF